MTELFIKEKHLDILKKIFDEYCPKATVLAYGSRIKAQAHDGSDLDLAIKDFNEIKCSIYDIKQAIQESDIPFLVDIFILSSLPESFQKEIMKENVVIYGKLKT